MIQSLKITSILLLMMVTYAGCNKNFTDELNPPTADAGNDIVIQAPVSTTTLKGSGYSANGGIVGYTWSLVTGPNIPMITNPDSDTTSVTSLIPGNYIFQLEVIDEAGLTGVDTVSVLVNPVTVQTLRLQPGNSNTEANVDSYYSSGSGNTGLELSIGAWTHFGNPENTRGYVKFDLSALTGTATILSARLSLYATHSPGAGNLVDAHSGSANQLFIQRNTSAWNVSTINWNNQPTTTGANQVSLAQSISVFQDDLDIDVTQLVKDMQANGNNGFSIKLQNESIYNIRQYYSSFSTTPSTRPMLVINYSN